MSGDSAEDEAVLILHFSLNHAAAEGPVVFGGRDGGPRSFGRTEARGLEVQRRENLARAQGIERLAAEKLDDLAEEDVTEVGVLGAGAGFGFKRQLQRGAQ